MNYYEMQPGVYYEVRRKSSDGTFTFGMIIQKCKDDSVTIIRHDGGWFEAEDFKTNPKMADFDADEFCWSFGEDAIIVTEMLEGPSVCRNFTNLDEAMRFYAQSATVSLYNTECAYRRRHHKRALPKFKIDELLLDYIPAAITDNMQVALWLRELYQARIEMARLENELKTCSDRIKELEEMERDERHEIKRLLDELGDEDYHDA